MRLRSRNVGLFFVLLLAGGCGKGQIFSASTLDPLGLRWKFAGSPEPLTIGLCYENQGIFDIRTWGEQTPWALLCQDLEEHFQRPVKFENLSPFQLAFHLTDSKAIDLALVSAADYLLMTAESPVGQVLAVSKDRVRQGVIVAIADAGISSLADLKGQRFAFGPKDDRILHLATLAALKQGGVEVSDIKTLLPERLQHHLSSIEAAKQVVYVMGTDAGVVEADEFDAYAETGGRWFPLPVVFSKDQFVELGRTEKLMVETIGEGPFVAGDHLDAELKDQMRAFLMEAAKAHPEAIRAMGFARFEEAPADLEAAMRRLAEAAEAK